MQFTPVSRINQTEVQQEMSHMYELLLFMKCNCIAYQKQFI